MDRRLRGTTFVEVIVAQDMQCWQNACMVSITIRSVAQETRDRLASRAAASGKSLQEFLVAELEQLAARPSVDEALLAIRKRAHRYPSTGSTILEDLDADRR